MKKITLTDKRKSNYYYNEAIKTLRTNIQLSGQSIKTILITSCFPNEGKSDVVLSLAQTAYLRLHWGWNLTGMM